VRARKMADRLEPLIDDPRAILADETGQRPHLCVRCVRDGQPPAPTNGRVAPRDACGTPL
jgi:hypothetical protein